MRACTPRAASLRTSASASGRVLYAASWMVQMPRGDGSLIAGSGSGADGVTVVVVLDAPVSERGAPVPAGTVGRGAPAAVVVVVGRADGGRVAPDAGVLVAPDAL